MRALPLLTLLLPLLASCERSPTGATPEETTLAFELRLGDDGAWEPFSARGQQPAGTSFVTPGPWVYTGQNGSNVVLFANHETDNGWRRFHVIVSLRPEFESVGLGDAGAGTCPGPEGRPCTFVSVWFESSAGIGEVCRVHEGLLVRTRNRPDRVSGQFSGTGICTRDGTTRSFAIRAGAFDVALPPPAPAPG